MDDFKLSNLSEAKNEYCARLVNIVSPLVIEGLKSIFNEAKTLCVENDEHSKYLMTFQNFLARVPKWNSTIIDDETKRIITKSQCNYLEDLITCVHIAQLKILTSIRVGQKQKKIEIDIPKLNDFIHKVYIQVARKVYSNVYLFEQNVEPLNYQKNMRECELIVNECILNVVRDSIPVEHILRSYIDETVEEDVEVEEEIIEAPKEDTNHEEESKSEEDTKPEEESKPKEESKPEEKTKLEEDTKPKEKTKPEEEKNIDLIIDTPTENKVELPDNLSFNDVDQVLDMGTNEENKVDAPKNIERLEQISDDRYKQRKLEEEEEEEEEKLSIGPPIHLGGLDVHNLNNDSLTLKQELLPEIQVLS